MTEVTPTTARHRRALRAARHHWMTASFLLGFLIDNLTLNRVDQTFDQIILAFYITLAMVSTWLLYAATVQRLPESWLTPIKRLAPLLMQYAFGGLLSGMLIFYGRAGAWDTSWPFLIIILIAIFGNETIHDRSTRLVYNLGILFVGLFSYVVLLVPVLTGLMGPWIFIGSGLIALSVMSVFVRLLAILIPKSINFQKRAIVFTLGFIFIGFNFLYFSNLIPPIPLSLKEIGIYHSVIRFGDGTYQVKYEAGEWWQPFKVSDTTIHPTTGESIFCFAKVFAPTKLKTDIVHVWEYKNPTTKRWEEHFRLPYSISGGSGGGYRGYTLISNFQNGRWRCSVETTRGQVLGRERFRVDTTTPPEGLVTEER